MLSFLISPYIVMAIISVAILLTSKSLRLLPIIIAPMAALGLLWSLPLGFELKSHWYGYDVIWIELDNIARFMASLFALTALAGGIFAFKLTRRKEIFTAYLYGACAMATVLAGDLISLMIAWELLAITSLILLWFSRENGAKNAAMRYGLWHFLGGALLLSGIALQMAQMQNISFENISLNSLAAWLILIGIWLNTGMFPFTSWVVDAYPKASPSGAVFLSSFTTKTAIIIMLRLFWGEEILLYPALITIAIAGIYSFIEDDMRRLLSWSILIQVSFMIVAIAAGHELAYIAVPAMAAVHILYKSTLFMASGLVLHYTGESRMSKISGLIDDMPFIFALALVAALTSMAAPLTAGFLAKTWLLESIDQGHLYLGWIFLTIMSGVAILPTGLWFIRWVFVSDDITEKNPEKPYITPQLAMLIPVALCLLLAIPSLWNLLLHTSLDMGKIVRLKEILHSLQLIFISLAIGFLAMKWFSPRSHYTLGIDYLWREAVPFYKRAADNIQPHKFLILITHLFGERSKTLFDFLSSPRSPFLRAKAVSKQSFEVSVFLAFFIISWVLFG